MATSSPTMQAALKYWAEKASCAEIDMIGTSQFARVWTYSIVYGLTLTLLITIPFRWCRSAKKVEAILVDEESGGKASDRPKTPVSPTGISTEPNIEEAKAHLVRTSATRDGKWQNPLRTPTYMLNEIGGSGTELYFRNLRNLGFIFAYMAALTGPIAAFCTLGNFGPDTGQFLIKTTIGNLGQFIEAEQLDPWNRIINLGCQGMEVVNITTYFGWLDFASLIVFLAYIVWFRFIQIPRTAAEDELEQVTPRDYGVVIDKLPYTIEDQKSYEKLLTDHLMSRIEAVRARRSKEKKYLPAPEVCELTLVRDYDGRLHEIKYRAEVVQSIDIARAHGQEKKVAKLEKYVEKIDKRLSNQLAPEEEMPVVRAYAILSCTEDVYNLLYDYRFADYSLFRCCQFNHRRFAGRSIRIRRAPQPTDIIWENQDLAFCSRVWRKALMYFVFFIILSISLVLIYTCTIASKASSSTQLSYIGTPECDPVGEQYDIQGREQYTCMVQNATSWTMQYATEAGGDILSCWCTAQGYEQLMGNQELFDACTPWFIDLGKSIGIMTASSLVVVTINAVLQITLIAMAHFERPLSMTSLNSSMMQKVFIAQTLNTGFVLFFVNSNMPQALQDLVSIIPVLGNLLFRGPFAELTRGWYAVVGVTILTNMLMNMVLPASVTIVKLFVPRFFRCCFSRGAKHQAELIQLYTNPEFEINKKYAQVLTTVYVTLTYSAGLPLLNLIASAFMFLMYWADRFDLLWGSKRPPNYDTQMAKEAAQSMLYAVPLHCVLAILMYGQPCTFPSNPLGGTLGDFASQGAGHAPGMVESFIPQVSKESTWMLFLLLVLLVALWVIWLVVWILGGSLGMAWDIVVVTCCPGRRRVAPDPDEVKEALARGERKINGVSIDVAGSMTWLCASEHIERSFPPASYKMERHPDIFRIAHLLRAPCSNGETPGFCMEAEPSPEAPQVDTPCSAPVDKPIAKRFLEALHTEYVLGTAEAVGKFFESEKSDKCEETLHPFEEQVRAADNKDAAIEALALKWGLQWP